MAAVIVKANYSRLLYLFFGLYDLAALCPSQTGRRSNRGLAIVAFLQSCVPVQPDRLGAVRWRPHPNRGRPERVSRTCLSINS
ncbi:MAG: hypothetical protein C7B45_14560 [Sulfobacillus acidophilus]|uniref:Uncharacterized protein n=1 Tax=Sulfobacillus acidophilus TaxID=53633 RepID=A0A2T2WE71_9FIRM|nr:MAG: hypothetical protein C7B45_14560 [Sulfobacillus acidophilus]